MDSKACPGKKTLASYCLGKLPENEMHFLDDHVATCADCQTTVENLENKTDTLIEELRQPGAPSEYRGEPELKEALERAIANPGKPAANNTSAPPEPPQPAGPSDAALAEPRLDSPDEIEQILASPADGNNVASGPRPNEWPTGRAPGTVEEFMQCLAVSELLSTDEVQQFIDSLPPNARPTDVRSLARTLVEARQLTKFQAASIYQGRPYDLKFGEYEVIDQIGAGGMGQVFKARHRTMERLAAIKVISPNRLESTDAVRRFHQEVRAAAKLTHSNIVITYDAGEKRGTHFMVMEYVDGCDLSELLKQRGPLPAAEAVDYVRQAADGMEYAHGRGIIHRDIKPGNLLVATPDTSHTGEATGSDGEKPIVKILDMGLARVFDEKRTDH